MENGYSSIFSVRTGEIFNMQMMNNNKLKIKLNYDDQDGLLGFVGLIFCIHRDYLKRIFVKS